MIGLGPNATVLFFTYASSGQKWSFSVHITMANAPYVHPRLDLILEVCQTFLIVAQYVAFAVSLYFEGPNYEDIYCNKFLGVLLCRCLASMFLLQIMYFDK